MSIRKEKIILASYIKMYNIEATPLIAKSWFMLAALLILFVAFVLLKLFVPENLSPISQVILSASFGILVGFHITYKISYRQWHSVLKDYFDIEKATKRFRVLEKK